MTKREFLEAVKEAALSDEMTEFAVAAIEALDKRNTKRRETPTKAQVANEGIKAEILAALDEGAQFASEVAEKVGVSTQKASALLRQLVAEGKVAVAEVKVKGKGALKQYTVAEGPQYLDGEIEA